MHNGKGVCYNTDPDRERPLERTRDFRGTPIGGPRRERHSDDTTTNIGREIQRYHLWPSRFRGRVLAQLHRHQCHPARDGARPRSGHDGSIALGPSAHRWRIGGISSARGERSSSGSSTSLGSRIQSPSGIHGASSLAFTRTASWTGSKSRGRVPRHPGVEGTPRQRRSTHHGDHHRLAGSRLQLLSRSRFVRQSPSEERDRPKDVPDGSGTEQEVPRREGELLHLSSRIAQATNAVRMRRRVGKA